IPDLKLQIRMETTRLFNHRRTEVDPEAEARLEAGKRVSDAAAEFKDPQAFRNQEPQIAQILFMEKSSAAPEFPPAGGILFRSRKNFGLSWGIVFHFGLNG